MPTQIEAYPATVVSTDDPQKLGRIAVKCPGLTLDPEVVIENVLPAQDWGWFYVPDIGELVEIESVAQDDQNEDVAFQAFIEAPDFRWRGKRHYNEEGDAPRLPHELFTKKNYGKRRGFSTPTGHVLMFDDTKGGEQVSLSWRSAKSEIRSHLTINKDGTVFIANKNGSSVILDTVKKSIVIIDQNSNTVALGETGIQLIDKFSNIIELKDGVVQILSQKALTLNAGGTATIIATKAFVEADQVKIESGDILVGEGADSPFVRHKDWEDWAKFHQHPTALGPSGRPIVPPFPTIASTTAKVK